MEFLIRLTFTYSEIKNIYVKRLKRKLKMIPSTLCT